MPLFFSFFLFFSLFIPLYACKSDYSLCIQKVEDSHAIQKGILQIPIKKNRKILYTHKKPKEKILKYDPFLSLYLVEERDSFLYPFDINMCLNIGTAFVKEHFATEAELLKKQIGLNALARYSRSFSSALLLDSCCFLEGVATPRGVIQKAYIKHFIDSKESSYGDIGIRVEEKRGSVVVVASDPFFDKNPFKVGDLILFYDNKKVKDASSFMRMVLFEKQGRHHTVKIKRDKQFFTYKVVVKKRYGGGELSDTFLESQGLYFDKNLFIVKVKGQFVKLGIKRGDRILQVDRHKVKNQKELREYLQKTKHYSSFLLERNGFEFFVNFTK